MNLSDQNKSLILHEIAKNVLAIIYVSILVGNIFWIDSIIGHIGKHKKFLLASKIKNKKKS